MELAKVQAQVSSSDCLDRMLRYEFDTPATNLSIAKIQLKRKVVGQKKARLPLPLPYSRSVSQSEQETAWLWNWTLEAFVITYKHVM